MDDNTPSIAPGGRLDDLGVWLKLAHGHFSAFITGRSMGADVELNCASSFDQ